LKNQTDERYGGGGSDTPSPKITILGVGNELLSDEGVGVHVAKELEKREIPPGVEVFEGGTDGFGLLHIISDTDHLIVIDSVKGGGEPGSIYRFDIKDAPNCPDLFKTSIGIEPKTIATGMELSPEIHAKIPRVIELVLEEVDKIL